MKTARALLLLACLFAPLLVRAAGAPFAADSGLRQRLEKLAAAAAPASGLRIEVELGTLDPRLRLAPCDRVEPYLPPGVRPWGRSRVGLRCAAGARWNVYLPLTVRVWSRAWVARATLSAGDLLAGDDLVQAEADLAAEPGVAITEVSQLIGRRLARTVPAGAALRELHLQPRQWFAAGDPVRVVTGGAGWLAEGSGVALGPGIDGRSVRVRTAGGRVVAGRASGPRTIEVPL